MKIQPLHDRVLVQPKEAVSQGGIIIEKDSYLHGKVLAVGTGKELPNGKFMTMYVKVGDHVIYGNYASTVEDKLDGKTVILIEQTAIVAIVREQA